MDDVNNLRPERINVTERSVVKPGGVMEAMNVVTFYVGQHGPFSLAYPVTGFDPAKAKQEMQAKAESIKTMLRQ